MVYLKGSTSMEDQSQRYIVRDSREKIRCRDSSAVMFGLMMTLRATTIPWVYRVWALTSDVSGNKVVDMK